MSDEERLAEIRRGVDDCLEKYTIKFLLRLLDEARMSGDNWRAQAEAWRTERDAERKRAEALTDRVEALERALEGVVALHDYRFLDKGIGTSTAEGRAWVRARAALPHPDRGEPVPPGTAGTLEHARALDDNRELFAVVVAERDRLEAALREVRNGVKHAGAAWAIAHIDAALLPHPDRGEPK